MSFDATEGYFFVPSAIGDEIQQIRSLKIKEMTVEDDGPRKLLPEVSKVMKVQFSGGVPVTLQYDTHKWNLADYKNQRDEKDQRLAVNPEKLDEFQKLVASNPNLVVEMYRDTAHEGSESDIIRVPRLLFGPLDFSYLRYE